MKNVHQHYVFVYSFFDWKQHTYFALMHGRIYSDAFTQCLPPIHKQSTKWFYLLFPLLEWPWPLSRKRNSCTNYTYRQLYIYIYIYICMTHTCYLVIFFKQIEQVSYFYYKIFNLSCNFVFYAIQFIWKYIDLHIIVISIFLYIFA